MEVMPRPKGSKNKKTLEAEARLGERIAEQRTTMAQLEKEQKKLLKEIAARKDRLKTVQKELRRTGKSVEKLTAKKTEVDAEYAEAAKTQEMRQLVSALMDSGLSSQEILSRLG